MCACHTAVETHEASRTVKGVWSIPKMGLKFFIAPLRASVKREFVRKETAGFSVGDRGDDTRFFVTSRTVVVSTCSDINELTKYSGNWQVINKCDFARARRRRGCASFLQTLYLFSQ